MRSIWSRAGAGGYALPTPEEFEATGRLSPISFLAGGLVALVAALAPGGHAPALVTLGLVALAVAGAAHLGRRRLGYGFAVASNPAGAMMIAAAVVAGGGGAASALCAGIYVFNALHAALALHPRHAAAVVAWAGLTAVVAVHLSNPEISPVVVLAAFVLVCGTVLAVAATLVRRLLVQAITDPLTGVTNRSAFYAAFERRRATADRLGRPISVACLDLNGFKRVNDTQGHAAGDRLLVAAADAWRRALRSEDLLARFGGDEFCVLLPGLSSREALGVASRLVDAMPAGTTCSAGVATRGPGESVDSLIARADAELYRAKARLRDGPAAVT